MLAGTLAGSGSGQDAAQDAPDGKQMVARACNSCHGLRLVESQRLSAAAWGKEVDKMVGWGAVVPERQKVVDFLAATYSDSKPVPAPDHSASAQ